jgi:hypothetical protein
MRKLTVVLAIGALALLASLYTVAAGAAPGNGATVINDTQCFSFPGDFDVCFTQKGEYNVTTTKSGNEIYQQNTKIDYTYTFDPTGPSYPLYGSTATNSGSSHYQYHLKDGVLHEQGAHFTSSFTSANGTAFCSSLDFHVTVNNGVANIQYDNFSNSC